MIKIHPDDLIPDVKEAQNVSDREFEIFKGYAQTNAKRLWQVLEEMPAAYRRAVLVTLYRAFGFLCFCLTVNSTLEKMVRENQAKRRDTSR